MNKMISYAIKSFLLILVLQVAYILIIQKPFLDSYVQSIYQDISSVKNIQRESTVSEYQSDAVVVKKVPNYSEYINNDTDNVPIPTKNITLERNIQAISNINVVYDDFRLYQELNLIHNSTYTPLAGDTCEVRKVKCVIIGVGKCGTRELIDFMSMHPNIIIKARPYLANHMLFDMNVEPSAKPMPCTYSDQIGMVKTDYFFNKLDSPEKLYRYDKDLKMILMVREPIDRMISAMTFTYFSGKEKANMTKGAMARMENQLVDPRTGKVRQYETRIKQSTYDSSMRRFLKYFKLEQFLIIEVNELRNDPAIVARRVEDFLGLKHAIMPENFIFNPEKKFYCLKAKRREMICYNDKRGRPKFNILKEENRNKLKNYFKSHNENFFELIGRRFEW